jgi:hypothetical protein
MKKLLSSLVISTTLVLSATAALADNRVADRRTERPAQLMIKPAPDFGRDDVIASERASSRRGTVTLAVRARDVMNMKKNLVLVSSDDRLDIRFVKITYASGRSTMLRGTQARMLDLPDGGRIRSIQVSYVNHGARGAVVKLVARSERPGFGRPGPGRG